MTGHMEATIPYLLLAYSEWLDADQRLLLASDDDERTHMDLIADFVAAQDPDSPIGSLTVRVFPAAGTP